MDNYDQDNNVLTKSDNESNFPINFQPMPKRFMVWDKRVKQWWGSVDKAIVFNDIVELGIFFSQQVAAGISLKKIVVVQSTNLFDKDGKEIFEGSVLQEPNGSVSVVEYDSDEAMFRTRTKNILDDMSCGGDYFELIGHILSNPELMEEKNV